MPNELSGLTNEALLREYREAVVYVALSNNGADEVRRAIEAKYEGEIKRRLKAREAAKLVHRVRIY